MKKLFVLLLLLMAPAFISAQETTGALQGTVKDATGAVVPGAKITVSTPTLVGTKVLTSDSKGYYHFSNLPPGTYTVTVEGNGFKTLKEQNVVIEVGHSPTVDLSLAVGAAASVVDVTSEAAQVDVTSVTTQSNITQDVIDYVPRGRSFQSVIQFAPSASNEPLMGNTSTNGSGSVSPGNGSNGSSYGYSIAGGSDSENSYLVEGQETANLIGGYSHTQVPFDFINEVQVKTSGIAAEYGGALGGVINVIMQKGTSQYHGSLSAQFENQNLDGAPNSSYIYDPSATGVNQTASNTAAIDQPVIYYTPVKDHFSFLQPGFTLGGPLLPFSSFLRDRIFFFAGFNPQLDRDERHVNFGFGTGGNLPFSQNTNTYYTTARIDARATSRVHVFGSWLYQLQRQNGEALPGSDSVQGFLNTSAASAPSNYAHTLGYVAPNLTVNTGADITVTQHLVSTTHFGYYFENYHDFGYPNGGVDQSFQTNGVGATDSSGNVQLPAAYQQGQGYSNAPIVQETFYNSNKAIQLDQDLSYYKSGWFGTHNFKVGYQLNRLSNLISQAYNQPLVEYNVGNTAYAPQTASGAQNCTAIQASTQAYNNAHANGGTPSTAGCQGIYGYLTVYDFGTGGKAISYNHGLYFQDTWTVGKGLTFDYGVRVEREFLPGEAPAGTAPVNPINFGWGDKIAPRIGAAWDVFRDGKLKLFGSYGQFYDQMKLNVAISSFGGQYWQNCVYALNTPNINSITPVYQNVNGAKRYCSGPNSSSQANFGGTTPAGISFIENVNFRAFPTTCPTCSATQEGVAPGLKPYEEHQSVAGVDYQITPLIAFEARYDRRRLDHVIEDSSIFNPAVGETFVIVNPGQGVNATFSGFCNFLYPTSGGFTQCTAPGVQPPNQTIPAARSYDGLELRVNKAMSNHWFGMFSYTYSRFRGNYTGLTSSDISDGGSGGRNSPNNSRAFDEPYFSYNANGGSSSGLLPTDRPNKFKAYAYYQLKYLHHLTSDFGVFEYAYSGTPQSSYLQDVGYPGGGDFPVYFDGRGLFSNVTQDPNSGNITVGPAHVFRSQRYVQTDFQLNETYKINERHSLNFTITPTNLFNQHAATVYIQQVDSNSPYINQVQALVVGGHTIFDGVPFYSAVEHPYNVPGLLNTTGSFNGTTAPTGQQTINSGYGKPLRFQQPRTIRLAVHYTF
jgi:hypothetical protein